MVGRRADLVVAVLACIQHMQVGGLAPGVAAVHLCIGADGQLRLSQRHMLPVSAVRRCAFAQKVLAPARRGAVIGVVIFDLVVVPRHDPGKRGVRGLQIGIGLVQRVARAVVAQAGAGRGVVLAGAIGGGAVFVDVVTDEQHTVQRFCGHVPVRAEVAMLVVLTGCQRECERVPAVRGRQRTGAAHGACRITDPESIPVVRRFYIVRHRWQPTHLDMDAVGKVRVRQFSSTLYDPFELRIKR